MAKSTLIKCLCVHTHTQAHTGRGGECWQRLNVFARSRGEGKKGSRRAETNACWLLLVELWSGIEGWGNVFIPSAPLSIHSHPSNPPTPLSPFWKGGRWKGQPPSGSTSPSKLTPTHSDGCLIVRDTGRALSLSNLKQIASPWGGDYWTSRDDKAGTVQPSGGWRMEGGKLVDGVCVCTRFSMFFFCTCLCHKKIMFVSMCFKCAHVWVTTNNACARSSHWSQQDLCQLYTLFPSLSHVHTSLSLILASSTSSLFHFLLCVSLDPAFSSSLFKSMLHLCAVTFEQRELSTTQEKH